MLITGRLIVRSSEQQLECELGHFIIEDKRLMKLPPGTHPGLFEMIQCLPRCYSKSSEGETGTTFTVKIIATLGQFAFLPREQSTTTIKSDSPLVAEKSLLLDANMPLTQGVEEPDAALFGALWPLPDVVKIDPTLNRTVFDKQRERLKALKYTFNCTAQTWHKNVS
ncbi:MAG: hypothetical protein K0R24_1002 [Gammaproteobacteria bacterium]|jgi:hypothetical protein|nr:hypothetical protein [Gammaproteobacteria bacterium]